MLNGNTFATLTFNQFHGGNQANDDGSMINQLYQLPRENTSVTSRGRLHQTSSVVSS